MIPGLDEVGHWNRGLPFKLRGDMSDEEAAAVGIVVGSGDAHPVRKTIVTVLSNRQTTAHSVASVSTPRARNENSLNRRCLFSLRKSTLVLIRLHLYD